MTDNSSKLSRIEELKKALSKNSTAIEIATINREGNNDYMLELERERFLINSEIIKIVKELTQEEKEERLMKIGKYKEANP